MARYLDIAYNYHNAGGIDVEWVVHKQETGTTTYYQFLNIHGYWHMMKSVRAGAVTTYSFTVPVKKTVTSLDDGWTNRASLTYTTFDEALG